MAETKGFTWDYDVNSQKGDEGVKPRARATIKRRGPIAHAQTMVEGRAANCAC